MSLHLYECMPEDVRRMSDNEINELIEIARQKTADISIVNGLIYDRNCFRSYYYKLYSQLVDLGIQPCCDYMQNKNPGRGRKNKGD